MEMTFKSKIRHNHTGNFNSMQTASLFLALSLFGTVTLASPPSRPATPDGWRKAATDDINVAWRLTTKNHPGMHDPANPGFPARLMQARQAGLALASRADDAAGYGAALRKFSTLIHDGHAGVNVIMDGQSTTFRWPGFVTVWRNDGLQVWASESADLPVGARVLACDGKPIRDLVLSNLFSFHGRGEEAGQWWVHARSVFFDDGNPMITLPQQCRFTFDGKTFEHTLTWKTATGQSIEWLYASSNGDALPVGWSEPRPGLLWVAMPTFTPNESERAAYRAMTQDVINQRQRFLEARAVVIDLRQNQGGSSAWSQEFASALWGKEAVAQRKSAYSASTEIWWRASPDNIRHVFGLEKMLQKQQQADMAKWIHERARGMQAAAARGEKFFIEKNSRADKKPAPPADTDFRQPVYVVVPGQCASACLDALDLFTRFPNTRLIGAPSSADSTYMEIRQQALPSGLANVIIPNKMYVNRPRGNGQVYLPAVYVQDLDWSSANIRKVIEADLAR